jgi:hypothetical protein
VQGSTLQFNQTLSEADIAAMRAADPAAAASEWDGTFRSDSSAFLDDELIESAIEYSRPLELQPRDYAYYHGFVDASGGTGHDSYTLSIGHKQDDHFVIDVIRGTPPGKKFDPQTVTEDYAKLLKQYRCGVVGGDYYGAEWIASAWRTTGVSYIRSELPKSQIYQECVPLFTRGLVRLPDHPKLLRELRLLERQTHRGGKDSVDHPRGDHDDYANACCGVLRSLSNLLGYDCDYRGWQPDYVDPDGPPQPVTAAQQASQRAADMLRASVPWWWL